MMDRKITLTIKSAPLPPAINAATLKSGIDNYFVVLNGEKNDDEQTAGLLHEMLHVWHRDFDSPEPADSIERNRHAELLRLLKILEQEEHK